MKFLPTLVVFFYLIFYCRSLRPNLERSHKSRSLRQGSSDEFGHSVSISGDYAIVGAR